MLNFPTPPVIVVDTPPCWAPFSRSQWPSRPCLSPNTHTHAHMRAHALSLSLSLSRSFSVCLPVSVSVFLSLFLILWKEESNILRIHHGGFFAPLKIRGSKGKYRLSFLSHWPGSLAFTPQTLILANEIQSSYTAEGFLWKWIHKPVCVECGCGRVCVFIGEMVDHNHPIIFAKGHSQHDRRSGQSAFHLGWSTNGWKNQRLS